MQKQTAINLVANNISSVFTKEDVINLLKGIDAEPKLASKDETDEDETDEIRIAFTDETLDELIEHVRNSLSGLFASDIVDKDSAQFGIDGRDTIILEDVDIDNGCIEDAAAEAIAEFFEDLKNNNK